MREEGSPGSLSFSSIVKVGALLHIPVVQRNDHLNHKPGLPILDNETLIQVALAVRSSVLWEKQIH
jgi:hypothetical protein